MYLLTTYILTYPRIYNYNSSQFLPLSVGDSGISFEAAEKRL